MDDSFNVHIKGNNMQGGEYRKIHEASQDLLCTTGYNDTFRPYFDDFQDASDPKVPWKTCPYHPGHYRLNNYVIHDYGDLLPPYLPGSEKWKFEITYFKDGVEYGGFNAYVILRTEKSLLEG